MQSTQEYHSYGVYTSTNCCDDPLILSYRITCMRNTNTPITSTRPPPLHNHLPPTHPGKMEETQPPVFNYILSFLLVGVAWGFTTPFIRRAAADFNARQEQHQHQPAPAPSSAEPTDEAQELTSYTDRTSNPASSSDSDEEEEEDQPPPPPPAATRPAWMQSHSRSAWLRNKIVSVFWTVVNLLRTPAYAVPLVINLTGSVWFFLLVGKHGTFPFPLPLCFCV